jgi:hypothetical protein
MSRRSWVTPLREGSHDGKPQFVGFDSCIALRFMGDLADIDRVQQDLVDVAPAERTAARRAAGAWDGTFVGFEIGLFDRNDACAVIYEAGKASDRQSGEKILFARGRQGGQARHQGIDPPRNSGSGKRIQRARLN